MLKLLTLRQRGERMYFKTTVIAGKTIEVMKGYKRRVAKGKRAEKTKLTPEEMDKVNQKMQPKS